MAEPVKFLLVDDIEDNLLVLAALLQRDGLELLKAQSGAQALELLLVHDIALAFLDVQMPGMDGFELAELMRGSERTKHVPIIFVTAGAHDPQRIFKGYESGAVDFLFKPVEPHVLKSKADVFFQLYRQRRELARALQLNELFIGILGHDLRNPLNAMLTGARLLESPLPSDQQARAVERMTSAGQRMARMIEQVLDVTRARHTGKEAFRTTCEPVDILSVVQCAIDELRTAHPTREIQMKASATPVTVGDADRLLQVFSNLIANALHHGTPDTAVTITVTEQEQTLLVRVHNHGVIPAALLPTLFDPFSGQRSSRGSGLGLGLYIVEQITSAHAGSVDVESNDSGTTVTVSLPRVVGRNLEVQRDSVSAHDH